MENTKYEGDDFPAQKRRKMNSGIASLKFGDSAVNEMLSTAYFKVDHALSWLDDTIFDVLSENYILDHKTLGMLGIAVAQLKSVLRPVQETIETYVDHKLNRLSEEEIEKLRIKAFMTNNEDDLLTYYKAASTFFNSAI